MRGRSADILRQISPEDLVSYQEHFDTLHEKAYRWDLWGAAFIMEGRCSDDGFMDFRYGLISKGREIHDRALEYPDTLAELGPAQYISNKEIPRKAFEQPKDPIGEEWDFDDPGENRKRLPKRSRAVFAGQPARSFARFECKIVAGQRCGKFFGPNLRFILQPTEYGWRIVIKDEREDEDISRRLGYAARHHMHLTAGGRLGNAVGLPLVRRR